MDFRRRATFGVAVPVTRPPQFDSDYSRWLFPAASGDSDKIVQVVKELLADRAVLQEMSIRAREVAEKEYNSAYIIDRYAEMVREYLVR